MKPVEPDNIPLELRALPQWIVWRREPNKDGKPTKTPYQISGYKASSTNPANWTTFENAVAVAATGQFDGIGFVFKEGGPYFGVDVDKCIDPERWVRSVAWLRIADQLGSYAEFSPSGRGFHVICKGTLPNDLGNRKGNFEIYNWGRYFCFTGHKVPLSPDTIEDATKAIAKIAPKYLGRRAPATTDTAASNGHVNGYVTDDAIIAKIISRQPYDALWRGDWSRYPSQSEADLALCSRIAFFAGNDCNRIRSLFSRSGLNREKWQREDYSSDTITNALAGKTHFYNWDAPAPQAATPPALQIVTAGALGKRPELRPPVIHGLLRRGETMNVIAAPKVRKSFLVHNLAISAGHGLTWLGRYRIDPARVLIIDNELHADTIEQRLWDVGAAMGRDCTVVDYILLRGRLETYESLAPLIDSIHPGKYSLIIVDSHYRMLGGKSENDNSEIRDTFNLIDKFAAKTQAGWVLVHHSSKGDQSEKAITDIGAGAGSQSRAADTHLVLREHEDDGCYVLEAVTRSFPPPEPVVLKFDYPLWSVREEADPTQIVTPAGKRKRRDDTGKAQAILTELANGSRSANVLARTLSMGEPRCKRLLAGLVEAGQVTETEGIVGGNSTTIYELKP